MSERVRFNQHPDVPTRERTAPITIAGLSSAIICSVAALELRYITQLSRQLTEATNRSYLHNRVSEYGTLHLQVELIVYQREPVGQIRLNLGIRGVIVLRYRLMHTVLIIPQKLMAVLSKRDRTPRQFSPADQSFHCVALVA